MKRSVKAATTVITIILSCNLYGQEPYASSSAIAPARNNIVAVENNNNGQGNAADPLVAARFSTLFPTAANQQWANNDNNCWVSFLNNGRKARASFSLKAKMNYLITDCILEQLPGSFQKMIKTDYSAYSLFNAIEIKAHDTVAYQVVLENVSNYITLKLTTDGIEKTQELTKTAQ